MDLNNLLNLNIVLLKLIDILIGSYFLGKEASSICVDHNTLYVSTLCTRGSNFPMNCLWHKNDELDINDVEWYHLYEG